MLLPVLHPHTLPTYARTHTFPTHPADDLLNLLKQNPELKGELRKAFSQSAVCVGVNTSEKINKNVLRVPFTTI